jgi:hypothetical protein
MPNWTTISLLDLQEARAAKLVEALTTKALGDGQPDPSAGIVAKVVDELRAAIGFSGRYVLDAVDSSVPASLKDLAVQKVIRLAKTRLMMSLNDAEREEERTYQKRLETLISGKWPVESPDSPLSSSLVQSSAPSQIVSSGARLCSGSSLSGL